MEPINLHIGTLLSEDILQYVGYKIYDAQKPLLLTWFNFNLSMDK